MALLCWPAPGLRAALKRLACFPLPLMASLACEVMSCALRFIVSYVWRTLGEGGKVRSGWERAGGLRSEHALRRPFHAMRGCCWPQKLSAGSATRPSWPAPSLSSMPPAPARACGNIARAPGIPSTPQPHLLC